MTEKRYIMILDWMRKIHQLEYAHRYQSIYFSNLEKIVSISAFVITTVVAFSYRFPSVEPSFYNKLPYLLQQSYFVPFASAIAAILTGLLTCLKPTEKSETHKKTGSSYEKLRHRIELILTTDYTEEKLMEKLETIKQEWESLDAINVSNRFFKMGKKKANSFKKYPEELGFLNDVENK